MRVVWLLLACFVAVFLGSLPGSDAFLFARKAKASEQKDTSDKNVASMKSNKPKWNSLKDILKKNQNLMKEKPRTKSWSDLLKKTPKSNSLTEMQKKTEEPNLLKRLFNFITSRTSGTTYTGSTSLKVVLSSLDMLRVKSKVKANEDAGLKIDPDVAAALKIQLGKMGFDAQQCLENELRCTPNAKTKLTLYFEDFLKKILSGDAKNKNSQGLGGVLSKLLGIGSSSNIKTSEQLQLQLKNLKLPTSGLLGSVASTNKLKQTLSGIEGGGKCLQLIKEGKSCDDDTKENILKGKAKL